MTFPLVGSPARNIDISVSRNSKPDNTFHITLAGVDVIFVDNSNIWSIFLYYMHPTTYIN